MWRIVVLVLLASSLWRPPGVSAQEGDTVHTAIGREVAIPRHLEDGAEFALPLPELLDLEVGTDAVRTWLHEYVGIAVYWATGRSAILIP